MKKSIRNSEEYGWGDDCKGWLLLRSEGLDVIQESMPPNTREKYHYHETSQQFFYILKGDATFRLAEATLSLGAGEGIHIPPGTRHQISNDTGESLDFLVISQPAIEGDRFEEPFNNHP